MAESRSCATLYVGPPRGGCHQRLVRLVRALLERGWTVHFVGLEPPLPPHPRLLFHALAAPAQASPSLGTLARAVGRVLVLCARERVRLVWTFGAIYSVLLCPLRLWPGRRLVTFLRGSLYQQEKARGAGWLRRRLARLAERVTVAASHRVVAVSAELARPAGGKGVVLPNEVASSAVPSPLEARRRLGLPSGLLLAGYAGAITPIKDLETLLAAAERVPELHVALLGFSPRATPYEEAIRARAQPLEGRAHLLEWTTAGTDLARAVDVVVLPSRHEGCPNLLLEAMAAGRACLGARCEGIRELLGHEELLFPVGDAGALATALRQLQAPAARERAAGLVSQRAQAFRFDWDERAVALLSEAAGV